MSVPGSCPFLYPSNPATLPPLYSGVCFHPHAFAPITVQVAIVGLGFNIANVVGYTKCNRDAQKKLQNMAVGVAGNFLANQGKNMVLQGVKTFMSGGAGGDANASGSAGGSAGGSSSSW